MRHEEVVSYLSDAVITCLQSCSPTQLVFPLSITPLDAALMSTLIDENSFLRSFVSPDILINVASGSLEHSENRNGLAGSEICTEALRWCALHLCALRFFGGNVSVMHPRASRANVSSDFTLLSLTHDIQPSQMSMDDISRIPSCSDSGVVRSRSRLAFLEFLRGKLHVLNQESEASAYSVFDSVPSEKFSRVRLDISLLGDVDFLIPQPCSSIDALSALHSSGSSSSELSNFSQTDSIKLLSFGESNMDRKVEHSMLKPSQSIDEALLYDVEDLGSPLSDSPASSRYSASVHRSSSLALLSALDEEELVASQSDDESHSERRNSVLQNVKSIENFADFIREQSSEVNWDHEKAVVAEGVVASVFQNPTSGSSGSPQAPKYINLLEIVPLAIENLIDDFSSADRNVPASTSLIRVISLLLPEPSESNEYCVDKMDQLSSALIQGDDDMVASSLKSIVADLGPTLERYAYTSSSNQRERNKM